MEVTDYGNDDSKDEGADVAPLGLPEVEATWEPVDTFRDAFPAFLFVEGWGVSVCGGVERCYGRHSIPVAQRRLDLLVTSMHG